MCRPARVPASSNSKELLIGPVDRRLRSLVAQPFHRGGVGRTRRSPHRWRRTVSWLRWPHRDVRGEQDPVMSRVVVRDSRPADSQDPGDVTVGGPSCTHPQLGDEDVSECRRCGGDPIGRLAATLSWSASSPAPGRVRRGDGCGPTRRLDCPTEHRPGEPDRLLPDHGDGLLPRTPALQRPAPPCLDRPGTQDVVALTTAVWARCSPRPTCRRQFRAVSASPLSTTTPCRGALVLGDRAVRSSRTSGGRLGLVHLVVHARATRCELVPLVRTPDVRLGLHPWVPNRHLRRSSPRRGNGPWRSLAPSPQVQSRSPLLRSKNHKRRTAVILGQHGPNDMRQCRPRDGDLCDS